MVQRGSKTIGAMASAIAVTMALTGCTIPFTTIEIPLPMPDLSGIGLPKVDLAAIGFPQFTLPIGVTASVEDARQTVLASGTSTVSQGDLVMPGYLTVGLKTAASSAPMCVEGDGASVYGLDVDVAAAVASELGLKVRYVPVLDSSSLGTQCDVVMNGKADNSDSVAIAGTYVESATCFFWRGDPTVSDVTALGGKSVGVQGGSMSENVLNATGLKMSQKNYANLNEAFDALAAGEVDYVLCEAYPGAYLATLKGSISFAGCLETPETAGMAVLATNAGLLSSAQTAFANVMQNGVLDVARSRWVGTLPSLTTDSVIANVPEGTGEAQTAEAASAQAGTGASDGSEAGSNAITSV